jgi:pyruvate formate lyase activating enzyme
MEKVGTSKNKQEKYGLIFDIQRFSLHDGPGIRTIIFLKGCPLHCSWCANPESQLPYPEIIYNEEICIKCETCIDVCPHRAVVKKNNQIVMIRSLCQHCGNCSQNCPTKAMQLKGKKMSIDQIMNIVEKDKEFYKTSRGGVTISGGEPLFQANFLKKLLEECHIRDLHTVVETAGFASWSSIKAIIPYTDIFFYDLKIMNNDKHLQYTGVQNDLILNNLTKLQKETNQIVIRIPVIPGINDDDENVSLLTNFLKKIRFKKIDLLPYHFYGEKKYKMLGRSYALNFLEKPTKNAISQYRNRLRKLGFKVEIIDY